MSQRWVPPISFQLRRQAPTGGSFKPASPDRARIGRTVRLNPSGHRTAVTVQCQLRVVGVSRLIRLQQGGAPPVLAHQAAVAPDLIKLPVKLFPDRNRITAHVRCDVWVKLHLVEFVAQPERRFEGAGAFDGVWADAACGFATRTLQAVSANSAARAHALASEDKIGITQFSA